jgi:hypothetical protein
MMKADIMQERDVSNLKIFGHVCVSKDVQVAD